MSRLRISAISFLNTAPLMWDFEHPPQNLRLAQNFEVHYTLPSACAEELARGDSDIGIIPVLAYATIPGLRIIPDIAIAARGAVRSILLVCRKPLDQVRSVALDTSSRTSVALTKVLFHIRWNRTPEFRPHAPELDGMLAENDAALLIGDPALLVDRSRYLTFDLAEEWKLQTGLPFVFAFWAVREQALAAFSGTEAAIVSAFRESRDHGLQNFDATATEWRSRITLSAPDIRAYLEQNIHYFLQQEDLAGLRRFYQEAAAIGALPAVPDLNFLRVPAKTGI